MIGGTTGSGGFPTVMASIRGATTTTIATGARTTGTVAGRETALVMTTIEGTTIGETETETSIEAEMMIGTETFADPHHRTPVLHHLRPPSLHRIPSANLLLHPLLLAPLPQTWLR